MSYIVGKATSQVSNVNIQRALFAVTRRAMSSSAGSQLVKAEVPINLGKTVEAQKPLYELDTYSQSSLKEYFDQQALLMPLETIIEKSEAKDFKYFLEQENFLKVVDTLEKFQQGLVNTQSEAGKDFILFKRQLYQMYEVQNRSISEHEAFSLAIDRKNLKWLYQANLDFVGEMQRINHFDNLVEHGQLKGSVFRAKALSPRKLQSVAAFGAAIAAYTHLIPLTLMLGSTLPYVGIAGAIAHAARGLSESNYISRMDWVREGDHRNCLRIKVQTTPFVSHTIVASPSKMRSVMSLGNDDMGADDTEANIVQVSEFWCEKDHCTKRDGFYRLPADAFRDKQALDWILAIKDEDETTADAYNDLMQVKHEQLARTGGLKGLSKMTAVATGYANMAFEQEVNEQLNVDADNTDLYLTELKGIYGEEALEGMKAAELYRLYKNHSLTKMTR